MHLPLGGDPCGAQIAQGGLAQHLIVGFRFVDRNDAGHGLAGHAKAEDSAQQVFPGRVEFEAQYRPAGGKRFIVIALYAFGNCI